MKYISLQRITSIFTRRNAKTDMHTIHRDWFILLAVFFVCVVVSLLLGIYFYIQIEDKKMFRKNAENLYQSQLLNEASLEKVAEHYRNRGLELERLKKEKNIRS